MQILSKFQRSVQRHLATDTSDFQNQPKKGPLESVDLSEAARYGAAGGVAGAAIGGGIGYFRELREFQANTETSSVDLDWQEPIYRDQVIGQIPRDETLSPSLWNHLGFRSKPTRINPVKDNVVRNNPVLDSSGQVSMSDRNRTFTGYGEPQVSWHSNRIMSKELTGYHRSVTSRYSGQWGHHKNWFPPEGKQLRSWRIDYSPKIKNRQIGSYKTPRVSFKRPDEVNSRLLQSALKGAGIGAVTGLAVGVFGSLAHQLINRE